MPDYAKINNLQIEITTYCNAMCPGCPRNLDGCEINDRLKIEHMSDDTWQSILNDQTFLNKIKFITLNGMFGDPMMHPNVYNLIEQIPDNKGVALSTNGSVRTQDFWSMFAELLNTKDGHEVTWSVDGLQSTNHLYRRNTDFDKIFDNMKSFNNAGGWSSWRYIVFDHNINQIAEASKIAKDIGCKSFVLNSSYSKQITAGEWKTYGAMEITAPPNLQVEDLKAQYDFGYDNGDDRVEEISVCEWLNEKSLQISVDGNVWPCCYTAEEPYVKGHNDAVWTDIKLPNNINNWPLQEILNKTFYKQDLDRIWDSCESAICNDCIKGNMKQLVR